jgi:rod shape-determining protein MreC
LAPPRVSRIRPILLLAGFLACWWLAPVAVRTFSRQGFQFCEAPALIAYSHVKDLQDFWKLNTQSNADLIQAGRDLAKHDSDLALQAQQAEAWREEAERLGDQLQMPRDPGFRYEFARVILRNETTWWQEIIIRKGSDDGIAPGQGVVFAGGVVGRVKDVEAHTAVVELTSSTTFRVDANLAENLNPVIFQGVITAPFKNPAGEVRDVSSDYTISPGQPVRLVTSSLSGMFPTGLTLGWVESLGPGSDGWFQSGPVKLDPALAHLHEVAVLVPETAATPLAPSSIPPAPASDKPRPLLTR